MVDLNEISEFLAKELLGWWKKSGGMWFFRHRWNTDKEVHAYLQTGNGMLEIIEAMREKFPDKDFEFGREFGRDSEKYFAWFWAVEINWYTADALPEAVARAAYAALKEQGDV